MSFKRDLKGVDTGSQKPPGSQGGLEKSGTGHVGEERRAPVHLPWDPGGGVWGRGKESAFEKRAV